MRRPEYWDWVVAAADAGGNTPDAKNPDPYAFASSFYGPGVVFGWYMILLTAILNIRYDAVHRPSNVLRLSPDLVAVLSYPAIAAGHLLVRLADFPPSERVRLLEILLDLFYEPRAGAPFFYDPNYGTGAENPRFVPWVRDASPPSIMAVQHGVGIEGPTRVVLNFVVPMLLCMLLFLLILLITECQFLHLCFWTFCWPWGRRKRWFNIGWVGLLVFAVHFWCCVLLITLIAVGWSASLVSSYILRMVGGQVWGLIWVFVLLVMCCTGPCVVWWEFWLTTSVWRPFWILLAVSFGGGGFYFSQILLVVLRDVIVPDTGVSFGELDQVATAAAGVITFLITLFNTTGIGRYIVGGLETWWRAATGRVSRESVEVLPLHSTARSGGQVGRGHAA